MKLTNFDSKKCDFFSDNEKVAEALIEHGVDMNHKDVYGCTALRKLFVLINIDSLEIRFLIIYFNLTYITDRAAEHSNFQYLSYVRNLKCISMQFNFFR